MAREEGLRVDWVHGDDMVWTSDVVDPYWLIAHLQP